MYSPYLLICTEFGLFTPNYLASEELPELENIRGYGEAGDR
ncbi:hypothetical protein [Calothrix rhizosoleniae]|nr:hypothetical protein [Calothrix rhizosoleniae]